MHEVDLHAACGEQGAIWPPINGRPSASPAALWAPRRAARRPPRTIRRWFRRS